MKRMNRVLSLLLVLCMIATLLPAQVLAADDEQAAATPITGEDRLQAEALPEALPQEAQAEQAATPEVTAKEIENPGVDLKRDQAGQQVQEALYDEDETVRVIVVLEEEALLDQGFTTDQIAANGARVARQVEAMTATQDAMGEKLSQAVERVQSEMTGLAAKAATASEPDAPLAVRYHYNVAFSGLALEVPYGALESIRKLDGVYDAFVAQKYDVPADMTAAGAAVSDPSMYATKETFGSAMTWETLGYTGQGMRIAVIDTGLDLDHPSFAAAPELTEDSLTKEEIGGVLESLNAYTRYASTSAVKLTADKLYRSEKIPYAFNYVDSGLDVTHDHDNQGDHGTHVAGIAAANAIEGTPVVGVAPDAQILVLKVFGVNGGAYNDDVLAAVEDAIRLNADVVNLSLGSPSGFTDESDTVNKIYGKILESDMVVAIAAGNSASAAAYNGFGTNLNLTEDPDNGIVSSPGTYIGATCVASLENTRLMLNYLVVGEEKVVFSDAGRVPFTSLSGNSLEYVMVPGYGAAEDYQGLDVAGRVAVVSRGSLDFTMKQQNAANAGAVACLVYDNVDGSLVNMVDAGVVPNAFITKASGELLAAKATDGVGTLEVMPADVMTETPNPLGGTMSDFSSWGVTPDLQLSPDVAAPGGNIYSTLTDGTYGTLSGTSMASPHIAGMSALVLEYLRDTYDLTDSQTHTVAEALIMSTAVPVEEPSGILYSPRKQGAGSANVYNAIISPAYLTAGNGAEQTPKISMGDDDNRTGVYRFSFQVNNLSDREQVYTLDGVALTDQVNLDYPGYTFMGETSRALDASVVFCAENGQLPKLYDVNGDGAVDMTDVQVLLDGVNGLEALSETVRQDLDLNGDGILDTADVQILFEKVSAGFTALDVVKVPANGTATVHVTVTLTDADKAYMDEYYENGIYVDGFVRLYAQSEDAVDLSLPFMGFYGNWSDAKVFDIGWYYEGQDVLCNRYPNVLFTNYGSSHSNLGLNPYVAEAYDPAHNVLSPNGDGYLDMIDEIYLGMMRAAELVDFTWTDEAGNQLFYEWYAYARKSFYMNGYGICMPLVYSNACAPYDFKNPDGSYAVANNDRVTLTIDAFLDDGELDDGFADEADLDDRVVVPVIIDTEAPKLYTDEIAYLYNPYTDGRRLEFYVSDNYDIAAVVPMTEAGVAYEYIPVDVKPGEKTLVSIDVSKYDATFRIAVCDYGCNESYYEISFAGANNVSFDSFYAYRRYSSPVIGGYLYATDGLNGWYSFEDASEMLQHTSQYDSGDPVVAAAEYVDGYIIGIDVNSQIFTMKAGSWVRTKLGDLKIGSGFFGKTYSALDMAFDYSTDTLYVLTDELKENEGGHLMTVDYLTGKVTDLGIIEGVDYEDTQLLTLACDNEGQLFAVDVSEGRLYTVDAETVTATGMAQKSSYYPAYAQSMTVDHETDKLYWAGYQGKTGRGYFFEVNKEDGSLLSMVKTADNAELSGLFKPYDCGRALLPENEAATALLLSKTELYLTMNQTAVLTCLPKPYYAGMENVTWTSDNPEVATVSDGIVKATGVGTATVTAQAGGLTVSCQVQVNAVTGEAYLYNSKGSQWVHLAAGQPQNGLALSGTAETGPITAAAYMKGFVYAFDCEESYDEDYNTIYNSTLYRLNPTDFTGTAVGETQGKILAMAVNYADGFLYGLTEEENASTWETEYFLLRVNPASGETAKVQKLSGEFGAPKGGMAIDYGGNFYFVTESQETYEAALVKGQLTGDSLAFVSETSLGERLADRTGSGSLVYSQENNGLLWADEKNLIHWIDLSTWEDLRIIATGAVGGQNRTAENTGLLILLNPEPETPVVAPSRVSIPEWVELTEHETVQVQLTLEPWNATCRPTYTMADETVATVDENGLITGVCAGETVLTVTVEGLEPLTAQVVVNPDLGSLYGFLLYDFGDGLNGLSVERWGEIPILRPSEGKLLSAASDIAIYAGAYYNGSIYASGQSNKDYLYYTLKIDPANFSYEVLAQVDCFVRDMAFDYTTGTMFAVLSDDRNTGALAQMDLKTGLFTVVGDTGYEMVALACDNEGALYAVNAAGYLYQLNKDTAEATYRSSTSMSGSMYQSMHYDYNNDTIYWAQTSGFGSKLMRLDRETGYAVSLGVIDAASGKQKSLGIEVTSLFSIPEEEPATPATLQATGVRLPETMVAAVGTPLTLPATLLPVSVAQVEGSLTWTSSDETVATVSGGVVTPVATGTVTITASTAEGASDSCTVMVLDHERKFYGYDELNTRWISFDETTGEVTTLREDAEGEAKITASVLAGETLYSYDAEGYFYTVDTETFQRTQVGSGIHGLTESLEAQDKLGAGLVYYVDAPYSVVDMTYDPETGKLYAAMEAYNISPIVDSFKAIIAEVDPATGAIKEQIMKDSVARPSNLLFHDGKLYFVDGFTAGMLTSIDLEGKRSPVQQAIFAKYWGDFVGGRSFVKDTLTGTVYAIRDLRTQYYDGARHESVLCTIGLGTACATPVCEIGTGLVVNSLFLK